MTEIPHNGLRIQRHRGPLLRIARYAVVGVALFAVTGAWLFRGPLFRGNFHTVIPNEVYRSAQLSPETLGRRIKELRLRSVINLRTSEKTTSWFKAEQEVTEVHGRVKEDFELRGGFRNMTVAPGESVVLEIGTPTMLESGRYKFFVDLVDERVKWFSDMGSEPITFELRVEDSDTLGGNRGRGRP